MLFSSEYTALKNARFERKFVFENKSVSYVTQLIKMNSGGFREIFQKRRVNNIYFDSPNLTNYYDNHFGKSERIKIRIRWYGNTFGEIKKPILEFKKKKGLAGKKDSFALCSFHLNSDFKKDDWLKVFNNSNLPEWVVNELKNSNPTLVNTYERKYFQSFDGNYRFTIDFNMKFFNIKNFNNNFNNGIEEKDTIVLELKYDIDKDDHVKKITTQLPVRLGKFSKYARGIELFHSHLAV